MIFQKHKKTLMLHFSNARLRSDLMEETVKYFKKHAAEAGIPYQTLINLYLRDCAAAGRKLSLQWKTA